MVKRIVFERADNGRISFETSYGNSPSISPEMAVEQLMRWLARNGAEPSWGPRGRTQPNTTSGKRKLRDHLYALQRGRCYLCGTRTNLPPGAPHSGKLATLDRVIPRGGYRLGNVALACRQCNGEKANRPPYACELLFATAIALTVRSCPSSTRSRRMEGE